jgi:serine/threonine protein kinase
LLIHKDEIKLDKDDDDDLIELGKGSAGTVYRGFFRKSMLVAVKKIEVVGLSLAAATKELNMYHLLAHPKIIRLFGYYTKNSNLFLVLELGNSNLRQLLESYSSKRLELEKAIVFALHISEAVMFLHGRNIVHLDIKSSNVIICDGQVAKITDLGTARKLLTTATQSTLGKSGRGRYHF